MNPELLQRALANFVGPDVLAALKDEEDSIEMVDSAIGRAAEIVRQVENFADAQQAAEPSPSPAVVNTRRGVA